MSGSNPKYLTSESRRRPWLETREPYAIERIVRLENGLVAVPAFAPVQLYQGPKQRIGRVFGQLTSAKLAPERIALLSPVTAGQA
jgi:hypothetical protein